MRLLLASTNAGKLRELRALCADLAVEVLGPGDWQAEGHAPLPDVAETGDTFLANALLKASAAHRATGLSVLADDSGLLVAALGDAPGVRSARFAGDTATDADNRRLLLEKLADVPAGRRQAAFQCVLVLCGPLAEGPGCGRTDDGLAWRAFAGRVEGEILDAERGSGGFGYDALFWHAGLGQTFAEATPEAKHALSHRGRAFARLRTYLAAARPAQAERKPLFLRWTGLHALTRAIDLALGRKLRYADAALENALGEQPQLGSKERQAVAELHWHTLRRLNGLALGKLALRGTAAPATAPDPRHLERRDAALLACLALADVDTTGAQRDMLRKTGPASALDGLAERSHDLDARLPVPRAGLDSALRSAAYAARNMPDVQRQAVELGYSTELVAACRAELGEVHAEAALRYMNSRGPLTVRANRLRASRDEVAALLLQAGVATVPLADLDDALLCLEPARLTALDAFARGLFEIQDEGSQRIAALVDARPGEVVIDWCAGAGGKSLALAAAMAGQGQLWCLDTHPLRLAECERRLQRAGVTRARVQPLRRGEASAEVPLADAVLVDAPCTSTGALRRNPELRWHLDADWLGRFAPQQEAILARAAQRVRPGGRLIYATCSLLRRENERVVEAFLASHADFTLRVEHRIGPADGAWLATFPLAPTGPDGFYCCALQRARPVSGGASAASLADRR